jgi:hypothetical protein
MEKSNKVIVSHLEILEHTVIVHARINSADVVMSVNHPEKLPSLHLDGLCRELSLLQIDIDLQRLDQLVLKSNEEFSIKGRERTAVSKLFKSGSLFPNI